MPITFRSLSLWLSLCVVLGLAGCGFKLRSSYELPPELQQMQLNMPIGTSELKRTLRRLIQSAGVEPGASGAKVNVSNVEHQRRVLSVDSLGNPREYELTATVTLSVDSAEGDEPLLREQQYSVQRDYLFDSSGVLSAGDQEVILREEMEQELARRVMRRLQALN